MKGEVLLVVIGWVVGFLSTIGVQRIKAGWDENLREAERIARRNQTRFAVLTELKTIESLMERPSAKLPEQLYVLLADCIKELPESETEPVLIVRAQIESWNASFPESLRERMIAGAPRFPEDLKQALNHAIEALEADSDESQPSP